MSGPAADLRAFLSRPLCVRCRGCARKAVFGSTSPEARLQDADAAARLVCRFCGARGAKVMRLCDDREASRWLADR